MVGMRNQSANYTVNVVREADADDAAGTTWCAAVIGVEGAVVWGDDFEGLDTAVRARLADLTGAVDAELTWQIDSDTEASREIPLSPM